MLQARLQVGLLPLTRLDRRHDGRDISGARREALNEPGRLCLQLPQIPPEGLHLLLGLVGRCCQLLELASDQGREEQGVAEALLKAVDNRVVERLVRDALRVRPDVLPAMVGDGADPVPLHAAASRPRRDDQVPAADATPKEA